jgi:hypothetical protein
MHTGIKFRVGGLKPEMRNKKPQSLAGGWVPETETRNPKLEVRGWVGVGP